VIDAARLIAAGVHPTQARAFAEPLRAACALHGIDTPARIGAFLGQVLHESSRLTRLEESLYYTTAARLCAVWPSRFRVESAAVPYLRNPKALANKVYADRMGNGDEASGDGWAYRGRGLIQLTGRANYTRAQVDCNRPYVAEPSLVAEPSDAALTAAWFWSTNSLSALADAWHIEAITRKVNGGTHGLAERQQLSEEAARAFA
jgi:putative chitinase